MKKTISVLLSVLLSMSSIQISFANTNGNMSNFKEIKSYAENQFADVSTNDWFAENVKKAYELGLVSGTSEITFSPKSDITIAETITLASRLHSIYVADDYTFNSSTPWYQSYVDYAVENKIITKNQFNNYSSPAKRIDFAVILEKALPDSCLNEINTVDDNMIPDVKKTLKNYEAVYKLYRAGIIVGNDNIGTFAPETTIDRASVATIISRMALPAMRSAIELKKTPVEKISLKETETIGMGANKKLNAVVYPENATNKELQWTSSNTSIATVDNGTVTAIKEGEVIITCTAENGTKAKCTVTIAPYLIEATWVGVYVNGEYIEPLGVITIPVGEPVKLEAQPLPQNANSNNEVTWSYTGSSSYLSLTPDGEILGKVVRDELRINACLPNGLRTLFYVNVKGAYSKEIQESNDNAKISVFKNLLTDANKEIMYEKCKSTIRMNLNNPSTVKFLKAYYYADVDGINVAVDYEAANSFGVYNTYHSYFVFNESLFMTKQIIPPEKTIKIDVEVSRK